MSKKILSIVLTLVMVLVMGSVALVSVSADLTTLPEQPENTYRYYFYMPPQWLNESTATTGNTAGIYWWEGTDAHGGWPGVAANKADVDGVYYYDVPTDVTTIVWNNFFDGGADVYASYYKDAIQTRNIGTEYYDPGESDLYPEGTENFDGMIYVTDFTIFDNNDYSGKLQFGGEWFYYYGNGEYGTSKVRGESEIRTDYATNCDSFIVEPPYTTVTTSGSDAEPEITTENKTDEPTVKVANISIPNGDYVSAYVGDKVTYTMDLHAARLFENIQAVITYDSTVLKLDRVLSDDPDIADWEVEGPVRCPNLDGVIFNAGTDGLVKFNASKVAGYNFKNEAKNLVNLEFTVIGAGSSEITTVIEEMTIKGDGTESYFTGGVASITDGIAISESLYADICNYPTTSFITTTDVNTTVTTTAEKTTVTTTEGKTTEISTQYMYTAPSYTPDPTIVTGTTVTGEVDVPPTGAASYIYVAILVMTFIAGGIIVLRKKARD